MPEPRDVTFIDLVWLLEMSHDQYLERFRDTSIRRAKHWMLQRNAAIALGNTAGSDALEPLFRTIDTNEHPVVRSHAAWAVGQIAQREGRWDVITRLNHALTSEDDADAREDIGVTIGELHSTSDRSRTDEKP